MYGPLRRSRFLPITLIRRESPPSDRIENVRRRQALIVLCITLAVAAALIFF